MKKDSFYETKITSGKYKNKKILIPSSNTTRSTKSLVKDSFFDTLQQELFDKVFIEAFGGSGLMGLEALSRGANRSCFIEIDDNSYEILKKNCINIDKENCSLVKGDCFLELKSLLSKYTNKDIIIYFDPPFNIRANNENIYQKTIKLINELDYENIFMVTIEHYSKHEFPNNIGSFFKTKSKRFGKTSLTYYMKD